jgi:hypothetical protein
MSNRVLKAAMYVAMGMSLAAALPATVAQAASDGSLVGRLTDASNKPLPDAQVTVRNPQTGFTRTVKADADGYYRFPYLPVGKYEVNATKDGAVIGKLADVSVGLGNATTANVTVGAITLEEIQVLGTRIITAVDVKSTESATNVTQEELARLPTERDVLSVAMLAPGLNKGDTATGLGGVSFGGSSVAENTVYVNGLNITDFYNRVGFSDVPYAFFKEFQIKTGGYSVEFGRTTGGVINAVTRSGTNEFEFGTEVNWEPSSLQTNKTDHFYPDGSARIIGRYDEYDRTAATFYAGGPIIKDKLFFFALYEARDFEKQNTSDRGDSLDKRKSDDPFWGAKIDWQITDKHLLELFGFSDESTDQIDTYNFDYLNGSRGEFQNRQFEDRGGTSWSATYTGYLTDSLSMKAMYGENERKSADYSNNDLLCSYIEDDRDGQGEESIGCTESLSVLDRTDTREAARLDFEWDLGAHLLRFGLDHENNTSQHSQAYPGDGLTYFINTNSNPLLPNGFPLAPGAEYVRTRRAGVDGEFETINTAYYLEDNWSVTPSLVLNAGLRVEAFDNKNSDGDSYIKMDNMIAPRFGFSWDLHGDNRTKVFGNAGRYFLPVANVINIKQAGGFFDVRTYYEFLGLEEVTENGFTFTRPILGEQLGPVDDSQGDGTVGDLRGEVDKDMDPVYQDELILGFQSMIDDRWSWGVRGIYRKLTNAIDDMEIMSNGLCTATGSSDDPGYVGWVMANPGKNVTVFTDTDCDGVKDGYATIDTSRAGWIQPGATYSGEVGWPEPKRTYKALEFMIDRAWDNNWSVNASYTLSFSEGNAEGPVNSDTNFGDAGRTEAFDTPWVQFGGDGYLPNDRRHSLKVRGAYALGEHWEFGATLAAISGRPINAFGDGNPFDDKVYQSYFVLNPDTGEYELRKRGTAGRTPWIFDLDANVTYRYSFSAADMSVKLSVYNLINQERITEVDEFLGQTSGEGSNSEYRFGTSYQAPRYALLTVKLDF